MLPMGLLLPWQSSECPWQNFKLVVGLQYRASHWSSRWSSFIHGFNSYWRQHLLGDVPLYDRVPETPLSC